MSALIISLRRTNENFWDGEKPDTEAAVLKSERLFCNLLAQQLRGDWRDSGYSPVEVTVDLHAAQDGLDVYVQEDMGDDIEDMKHDIEQTYTSERYCGVEWFTEWRRY